MRGKRLPLLSIFTVAAVFTAAIPSYSQVQTAQTRVPQQVAINGQTVNAVSVVAEGGGAQTYRCLNPQQYVSLDGASQGWACYDQASGVWLLNALPPAQAQAPPVQPQVQTAPPVQQPQVQRAPLPVSTLLRCRKRRDRRSCIRNSRPWSINSHLLSFISNRRRLFISSHRSSINPHPRSFIRLRFIRQVRSSSRQLTLIGDIGSGCDQCCRTNHFRGSLRSSPIRICDAVLRGPRLAPLVFDCLSVRVSGIGFK